MEEITPRQHKILKFIRINGHVGNQDILQHLESEGISISRITITRELAALQITKHIIKERKGRSTRYRERANHLLRYIDVDKYVQKDMEKRSLGPIPFNPSVFEHAYDLILDNEKRELHSITAQYRKTSQEMTPGALRRRLEQLMIEFTWKSSRIEGNTYTLIETETLIKDRTPAKNHTREEAIMILNQKDAFDAILESPEHFQNLSMGSVENLHKIITQDLGITTNIRKHPVRIGGSCYIPLDNPHQIREALDQTVSIINDTANPFEKAFIALLMISYIQPFEDGNKRTARMTANALLAAGNCCPLSWRTIDENDYKKATIVFYETLSARYFKQLFVEQCVFAAEEYFRGDDH